jgi:hypothetical protein
MTAELIPKKIDTKHILVLARLPHTHHSPLIEHFFQLPTRPEPTPTRTPRKRNIKCRMVQVNLSSFTTFIESASPLGKISCAI